MDLTDGTHSKASEFATEVHDVITSMPENVVTSILNSLPIKDAVRTGILSRNWRFKWTLLTQLVFDDQSVYNEGNLSRLLLQLKGPLTKFVLHTPTYKELDIKDVNHWIMFLSSKEIKEFTLINNSIAPLKLPSHLFSCLEMKHLKLCNCCLRLPPTFCGFPNLLSLDLFRVTFESDSFGRLITKCPLLEILKVSSYCNRPGKLKLNEIANLKNLRVLSLPLCELDYTVFTLSIICQLGSCFPRLQELNLNFRNCKFPQGFDDSEYLGSNNIFSSLKTLTLSELDLLSPAVLSSTIGMIWGSPNLKTLEMEASRGASVTPPGISSSEVDHNTLGQLQLRNVVLRCSTGSNNELCLIAHLLAKSPLLNKLDIHPATSSPLSFLEIKFSFATKLLKLERASPTAKVDLY